MQEFSFYKKIPSYPVKPKRPDLAYDATSTEIRIHADAVARYEQLMQKYNAERVIFKQAESDLLQQFQYDALDDVGLTGHPAAERAYEFAWQNGHSAGLQEVYSVLVELAYVITGVK